MISWSASACSTRCAETDRPHIIEPDPFSFRCAREAKAGACMIEKFGQRKNPALGRGKTSVTLGSCDAGECSQMTSEHMQSTTFV